MKEFIESIQGNIYLLNFSVIILAFILLKLVKIVFKKLPVMRKSKDISRQFAQGSLRALIVLAAAFRILEQSESLSKFYNTILMSSSLLVVVLGFIFQEGLSNIVHGFILTISKPFDIGDRIRIDYNGKILTGHVESINLRSTQIKNILNNAIEIVPNTLLDNAIIENAYYTHMTKSNFIDIEIDFDSDIDKASELLREIIENNKYYVDTRTEEMIQNEEPKVTVFIREINRYGIALRAKVVTQTVEENFFACSEIRAELLKKFKENNIQIAHYRVRLQGPSKEINKEDLIEDESQI